MVSTPPSSAAAAAAAAAAAVDLKMPLSLLLLGTHLATGLVADAKPRLKTIRSVGFVRWLHMPAWRCNQNPSRTRTQA